MKQFIYHTNDFNGFEAMFLQSEKTVAENKAMGIRQDWTMVTEVKSTKERGRNKMGYAYKVYESPEGKTYHVYQADYSAVEVENDN